MSLEDKIINPMVPAELPGQRSEPAPKPSKRRRKNGGTTGAASAKAKKDELDEEVGGDSTAVLTLGSSDELRRPQKKMLFESASEGATLAFTGAAIRRETSKPAPNAPAAKPFQAVPSGPVAAPVPEVSKIAPLEAPPPAAPAPKSERKDAAAKTPVFQVAALAVREPEPQPEPKDEAPWQQPELALTVDEPAADEGTTQPVEIATAPAAKAEEDLGESLTLSFDTTLADGLAERAAAVETEVATEPTPPAPTSWIAVELDELRRPETAPAAIERAFGANSQPAPAIVEPPAPVQAAPVAEAPQSTPKPESDAPNRGTAGLSRSEMIARAARLSARATVRPTPTAAETLAAARTAQQQMRSADLPKTPGDIYGYWTRVKNGRRFPSRADFDAEQVAEHWPNSMLLTCGNGIGAGSHGNFSSVLRLGANRRTRPDEDLNFTSMITEWILATGGEAARAGTPVQDTEVFPTPDGTHAYKIVALPLSENQTRVDHVLCHLSRS